MKKIIGQAIYWFSDVIGFLTTFIKIVRARWMKRRGISNTEIARRLKISEFDVQKILKG